MIFHFPALTEPPHAHPATTCSLPYSPSPVKTTVTSIHIKGDYSSYWTLFLHCSSYYWWKSVLTTLSSVRLCLSVTKHTYGLVTKIRFKQEIATHKIEKVVFDGDFRGEDGMPVLLAVVTACFKLSCENWQNWKVWFAVCGERGTWLWFFVSPSFSACSGSVRSLTSHLQDCQAHWARILHLNFLHWGFIWELSLLLFCPHSCRKGDFPSHGCHEFHVRMMVRVLMVPFCSHSPWNFSLGFLRPHPDPLENPHHHPGPPLMWPEEIPCLGVKGMCSSTAT